MVTRHHMSIVLVVLLALDAVEDNWGVNERAERASPSGAFPA